VTRAELVALLAAHEPADAEEGADLERITWPGGGSGIGGNFTPGPT